MLTILKDIGMKQCKNRNRRYALCKCSYCNNIVEMRKDTALKSKSCGCIKSESVSKSTYERLETNRILKLGENYNEKLLAKIRNTYNGMKQRCYNNENESYKRYGGRGIKMCDEWLNDFYSFARWCYSNNIKKDLTIDRIDNNGNYEPNNCRFTDNKTQCRNRRTNVIIKYNGKNITLIELSENVSIPYHTLNARYNLGDEMPELIRPLNSRKRQYRGNQKSIDTVEHRE